MGLGRDGHSSQASGIGSMFYRSLGVPAYNASPVFTRSDESFSHGLNERVRTVNEARAHVLQSHSRPYALRLLSGEAGGEAPSVSPVSSRYQRGA
jgi:hypothetical protein